MMYRAIAASKAISVALLVLMSAGANAQPLAATLRLPDGAAYNRLALVGDTLLISSSSTWSSIFLSVNVADPAHPEVVGAVSGEHTGLDPYDGANYDMAVTQRASVVVREGLAQSGVYTIDLTDPRQPLFGNTVSFVMSFEREGVALTDVATKGDLAYIVGRVTSPPLPAIFPCFIEIDGEAIRCEEFFRCPDYCEKLYVIDVHDPLHPTILSATPLQLSVEDVAVIGGLALMPLRTPRPQDTGLYGMFTVDITDPVHPKELKLCRVGEGTFQTMESILVWDNHLFSFRHNSVTSFGIIETSPLKLQKLDEVEFTHNNGNSVDVFVDAGIIYNLVDYFEGIDVIDARDPSRMKKLFSYDPPDAAFYGVTAAGGYAYVTVTTGQPQENWLWVFDFRDLIAQAEGVEGEGEGEVEAALPEFIECSCPFQVSEGQNEGSSPTPTPSRNICPTSRLTASTALAGKLERLREWRDGLLETKIGETIAAGYYGRK